MIFLVMGENQPRDFAYFVLSLVAVWFGTSIAAREIIRERPVYNRERMVNLGLMPYIFSKLFILGIIVGVQCLLLFLPFKFLRFHGFNADARRISRHSAVLGNAFDCRSRYRARTFDFGARQNFGNGDEHCASDFDSADFVFGIGRRAERS